MDCLLLPPNFMTPCHSVQLLKLKPKTLFSSQNLQRFRLFSSASTSQHLEIKPSKKVIKIPNGNGNGKPSSSNTLKANLEILKENWLFSLSQPSHFEIDCLGDNERAESINGGSNWVIGVDPDVSGALALLKFDHSGSTSAEVFDSPVVQVSVGKTRRRRLDARSIVQLVQSIDAPIGTTAYLEQSTPFPGDGKQGWWSGGFGYGIWIGILVASGFSVVPVPSNVWKKEFELAGSRTSKDDSRELAGQLFPDLTPMLKRKKDHGRAEALLIAAYGKGLNRKSDELCGADMDVKL